MSEENKKVENLAEKAGQAIGEGFKKSVKAVDDFGKGIKSGIKEEE